MRQNAFAFDSAWRRASNVAGGNAAMMLRGNVCRCAKTAAAKTRNRKARTGMIRRIFKFYFPRDRCQPVPIRYNPAIRPRPPM